MADMTTLDNVKQYIGVSSTDDDALLSRLITAVSEGFESCLNRVISSAQYTELRDGNGKQAMMFANMPATAVSSVKVNGVSIPAAPDITSYGYRFDESLLTLNGATFEKGRRNIEIAYTAGYVTTPKDLEQACIEVVALRYKERDRIGHQSKSIGGENVTFITAEAPKSVLVALDWYKKVVPL
jgi:hypothetical protein